MNKLSQAQTGQMMKLAAENLRALSARNQDLETKVAHYEKKDRAERIAHTMEDKGLEPDLSLTDKVAGLMRRDDLHIVEEAVGMSAPQTKFASVHEDSRVTLEGGGQSDDSESASNAFVANLTSLD